MKTFRKKSTYLGALIILSALFIGPSISHAATTGYAWGENVGWIDFGSTAGVVTVTDSALSGYAYGENIGWIVLDGVTNSGGTLGGYAWGENVGWIDFSQVILNTSTGIFSGYAYGENIGWINFDTSAPVTTSWRPAPASPTPVAQSTSHSGSVASAATLRALGLLPPMNSSVPGCPAGMVCTPKVNAPITAPTFKAPVGGSVAPTIGAGTFTRSLGVGEKGNDVKTLQQFLNSKGFTVAKDGAGSPGFETSTFGSATRAALIRFQKANGISPAVGYFGPLTRAAIIKLK